MLGTGVAFPKSESNLLLYKYGSCRISIRIEVFNELHVTARKFRALDHDFFDGDVVTDLTLLLRSNIYTIS